MDQRTEAAEMYAEMGVPESMFPEFTIAPLLELAGRGYAGIAKKGRNMTCAHIRR